MLREEISKRDFDRAGFVKKALESQAVRDELVRLVLSDPGIMVYYHCYYVLQDATAAAPRLFIGYWDEFAKLLHYTNSYHRDIGLTLLANLIAEDERRAFDGICADYLDLCHDEKFMTGACCIGNLAKIARARKDKLTEIMAFLLTHARRSRYTVKQEELLKAEILAVIDQVYDELQAEDLSKANDYILSCRDSVSPKTRKLGRELTKRRRIAKE